MLEISAVFCDNNDTLLGEHLTYTNTKEKEILRHYSKLIKNEVEYTCSTSRNSYSITTDRSSYIKNTYQDPRY